MHTCTRVCGDAHFALKLALATPLPLPPHPFSLPRPLSFAMVSGVPRPQDCSGAAHLLGEAGVLWSQSTFVEDIQQRGKAVIDARGMSSAASAAEAILQHTRDWLLGSDGKILSMGEGGGGGGRVRRGCV